MIGNAHACTASVKVFDRFIKSVRSDLEALRACFAQAPSRIRMMWCKLANLLYEPLSCTAMLVLLSAVVIWVSASPSMQDTAVSRATHETARSNISQGLSVALASLSIDNAFALVPVAVSTARSSSVSPDLNYPYGLLDERARHLESV